MKKLLLVLLAAIMLAACSNDSSDMISEGGVKTVSLNLGGDFTIQQLTRSTSETAQDIWVFDIMDNKLIQTTHKTKDDSDFANPIITLKYGKHDIYIIVSNGKEPNYITATNTITWEVIGDTFRGHLSTNVDAKSENTLNITLDRVVALIDVKSTDGIPGDAQSVSIKIDKWYYGINYITGDPTALVTNYAITVENLTKDSYFNTQIYEFATKEERTANITINASVAYSNVKHTIPNVPLKANTTTLLKGNIFTTESSESPDAFGIKFNVNDTWGTGYNVTW